MLDVKFKGKCFDFPGPQEMYLRIKVLFVLITSTGMYCFCKESFNKSSHSKLLYSDGGGYVANASQLGQNQLRTSAI